MKRILFFFLFLLVLSNGQAMTKSASLIANANQRTPFRKEDGMRHAPTLPIIVCVDENSFSIKNFKLGKAVEIIFFDDIGSTLYEVNVEIDDSYIVLPMFLNEIQRVDSVAILSDGIIYYGKFN